MKQMTTKKGEIISLVISDGGNLQVSENLKKGNLNLTEDSWEALLRSDE